MIRAMRKRYFARSRPGILPQTFSKARRAVLTEKSTSASPPQAISVSLSSVAGLIVSKYLPVMGATNLPPMNNSWRGAMGMYLESSGAGAYPTCRQM